MKRFWAIFKKEFRQIRRDPLSLGLLIFVPAMLLVLYGYALTFDIQHTPMAVLDLDKTQASRSFLDSLFQNPYFDLKYTLARVSEADALLAHGQVRGVLIVPDGFAKRLDRGEKVAVQVLIDGADANTASVVIGYIDALADRATRQVRMDILTRSGIAPALPVVTPEPRIWFNPEMVSARFLVPGLIALLLMLSCVIATSLSIVRERERETMAQIMVSPVRPEELILGKTLPYVVIGLLTMVLILALSYFLFGVVIRGSFILLGLTVLLFLFAALGMGVLISAVTRSQLMAFQIAILSSLLPSIILSGFIFPIKNMPVLIQAISLAVIPRYFVAALRGIILKGATFSMVWPYLLALLFLGVVYNLLAVRHVKKML